MHCQRPLLLAALVATAACSPDLKLPPDALVSCASDADCPGGAICKTAIKRCVAPGGDQTPPAVTGASLAPALASLGHEIVVTFDSTKPLAEDPVVSLVAGSRRPFARRVASGTHYVYAYQPDGTEGEGTWPVVADLVDTNGNAASEVALANAGLDFTAPQIRDVSASKSLFHAGDTVQLAFRTTEVGGVPTVTLASGGAFTLVSQDSGSYVFSYAVTGSEPAGAATVHIATTDAAGNAAGIDWSGLSFDFGVPTVLSSSVITPEVRSGSAAALTFTAAEPLGADPVVQLQPRGGGAALPMTVVERIGATFTLSYQVNGSEAEGIYDAVLTSWSDLAGNPGPSTQLGAIAVDLTPPSVTPPGISFTGNRSLFKGGEVIALNFTTSEPLASPPEVTLTTGFPKRFDCAASGLTYQCTLSSALDPIADLPEGPVGILVQLTDLAGNSSSASATATLDYTGPSVVQGSESVQLLPDASNPLSTVGKATGGTVVRVGFTMSESIDLGQPVTVSSTDGSITFTPTGGTLLPGVLRFDYPVPGNASNGTYALEVTATDLAGNVATSSFGPTFDVDTLAPASPSTAAPDAFVYARTPWGSSATGGSPDFRVISQAGMIEPGARLIVYDAADLPHARELGRSPPRPDPDPSPQPIVASLIHSDVPVVYVTAVDAAGNQSAPSRVQDVTWTATLDGKVARSTLENPHRLEQRSWFDPVLSQHDDVESSGAGSALPGDGQLTTTYGAGTWRQVGLPTTLGAMRFPTLAFDYARNRLVLTGNGDSSQVWEWSTSQYVSAAVADPESDGNPVSLGSNLVADSKRGKVAVVGSAVGASLAHLWYWTGTSWRDDQAGSQGLAPGNRSFGAASYDSAHDQIVLFGGGGNGCADGCDCLSTCLYTPGSGWAIGALTGPPPRLANAMTFDAALGETVMFGGGVADGSMRIVSSYGDTWLWDGSGWNEVPAGAEDPPAMTFPAMAYDPVHQVAVLFGGCSDPNFGTYAQACNAASAETYIFDGSWHHLTPADPEGDGNPGPRYWHSMEYSPVLGGIVLHGGCNGFCNDPDLMKDTWLWNGSSWQKLGPTSAAPPPRKSPGLAYDSARHRAVLFSGVDTGEVYPVGYPNGDTWEWNGVDWTQLDPAATAPSARGAAAMAYDPSRGRTVLFGGCPAGYLYLGCSGASGETWEWDGSTWTQITPTDPEGDGDPSPRMASSMAYDPARGQLLLYGGCASGCSLTAGDLGDLWTWNGTSWKLLSASNAPGTRRFPAMTFDSTRQKIVLFGGGSGDGFGGYQKFTDLWEWDGANWSQIFQNNVWPPDFSQPTGNDRPAMVFDPERGKLAEVFGQTYTSQGASTVTGLAWQWDDPSWSSLLWADPEADSSPIARAGHAVVFEDARGKTLLFGGDPGFGWPGGAFAGETWEWEGGASARPGQVAEFDFSVARMGAGQIESVNAAWNAGGSGAAGDGVQLLLWDLGGWQQVAQGSGSAASPDALSFTASTVQSARLFSSDPVLHLAAVPLQANGAGAWGAVSTDYVELSVKYHLF